MTFAPSRVRGRSRRHCHTQPASSCRHQTFFFAWSLGGQKGCTLCRFWIFLGGFCEGIVRRFPHFLGRLGLGRIQRSENRAVKFCQRSRNGCSWGVPDPAPGGLRPQNPKPWLQIFSVTKNSRYPFFIFVNFMHQEK